MTLSKALEILEEIEENVGTCCAITTDVDEIEDLIYKLRIILKELQ